MKITSVPLSTLKLDPKNARKHNPKNIKAIKGSLEAFGQQKPIVVDTKGIIIAGNGTYVAAKELGWEKIDVVETTLDKTKAKAFALADNRTAELAEWDDGFLDLALKELTEVNFDLGAIGFETAVDPDFQPGSESDQAKLDEKKKHLCPNCGHEFA